MFPGVEGAAHFRRIGKDGDACDKPCLLAQSGVSGCAGLGSVQAYSEAGGNATAIVQELYYLSIRTES